MCTSIAMKTQDFYFGRTMDFEYNFNESVVFTPRNYPLPFRRTDILDKHYAILGMATVVEGYPLYADAVNEAGLCIAGLNFPDTAYYRYRSKSPPCHHPSGEHPFQRKSAFSPSALASRG